MPYNLYQKKIEGKISKMRENMKINFLKKLAFSDFIRKYSPHLKPKDVCQYLRYTGNDAFMFEIQTQTEQRTVLKTEKEVAFFISVYKKHFQIQYTLNDFNDQPFTLAELSNTPQKISQHCFYNFFEMDHGNIHKIKSVLMKRKNFSDKWYKNCCVLNTWVKKWIIITQKGIVEKEENVITDFLLFDGYFEFSFGPQATGDQFGIILTSIHRKMILKANSPHDFYIVLYYLQKRILDIKRQNIPFRSSSFVRKHNSVNFIIDGKDYFQTVANLITKAKKQIFICAWWLSPQLPLIRPYNGENKKYRIDRLLKSKAKENVKVYILHYRDWGKFVVNNSKYTLLTFSQLHPNIKIMRHPNIVLPSLWSHHEKLIVIDQQVALLGGLDLCYGRYDTQNHPINQNSVETYPGIEYNNVRIQDFQNVKQFERDGIERSFPRLPWHDVALAVQGEVVLDLSNHFIQYWNLCLLEQIFDPFIKKLHKTDETIVRDPFQLNQKVQTTRNFKVNNKVVKSLQFRVHEESLKEQTHECKVLERKKDPIVDYLEGKYLILGFESSGLLREQQKEQLLKNDTCQLLRSASEWSIGLEEGLVEKSIYHAYVELIKKAKHFIYIQNQFFISATGDDDSYVQNQIANAIYYRIKKAVEKKQEFKVIVMLPLLPGFEGDITKSPPITLKLILDWQYQTISQGKNSLIQRLKKITPEPQNYLEFFGLRQHGILEGKPVTEIIYIHTKLIIIDDCIAVCGSANINDRSMEGERDSELCLVVAGGQKIQIQMKGQPFDVPKKVHQLRKKLFIEHFDLQEFQSRDPLNSMLLSTIREKAKANTKIYRELFGCLPDNKIKTYEKAKDFSREPTLEQYRKLSKSIKGHCVEFPLYFLQHEQIDHFYPDLVQDVLT